MRWGRINLAGDLKWYSENHRQSGGWYGGGGDDEFAFLSGWGERSDGACGRVIGAALSERIAGGGRRWRHVAGHQPVGGDGSRGRRRRSQRRCESRRPGRHADDRDHGLIQPSSASAAHGHGTTAASPAGQVVSQPATTAAKRAPKLLTKLA